MVNEARFGYTQFYNTNGTELAFSRDVVSELKIPGLNGGPAGAVGHPERLASRRLCRFRQRLGRPVRKQQLELCSSSITSPSFAASTRSSSAARSVSDHYNQVGNQFARGAVHLHQQRHPEPGHQPGAPATTSPTSCWAKPTRPKPRSRSPRPSSSPPASRSMSMTSGSFLTKLTISLGLRYELTPPWEDQTGTLFNGIVPYDPHLTLANANITDHRASSRSLCARELPARTATRASPSLARHPGALRRLSRQPPGGCRQQ